MGNNDPLDIHDNAVSIYSIQLCNVRGYVRVAGPRTCISHDTIYASICVLYCLFNDVVQQSAEKRCTIRYTAN